MKKYSKIFVAVCLITFALTQEKVCKHLGFGQAKFHKITNTSGEAKPLPSKSYVQHARLSNDEVYRWDEQSMDWVIEDESKSISHFANYTTLNNTLLAPINLDWRVLMDIRYESKYFPELEMDMYAPVFSEEVNALDKKEVLIEGFVIPLDQKGKMVALSFNPYASCFFCGEASPASVISLYLKNTRKRYKIDDFVQFRGVLHLNHDNPDEFYYILRNAEEAPE
ncbi:MAG: hypothetical protein AAF927_10910 [Bacteroidota bacterium]